MNTPEILGLEVNTPDGRGSIVSLLPKGIVVKVYLLKNEWRMHGSKQDGPNLYLYHYEEVELLKGRYNFQQ